MIKLSNCYQKLKKYRALVFYTSIIFISAMGNNTLKSEEITLQHNGLILNANLEYAGKKPVLDEVILLLHGGLAHRDMETMKYLRSLLLEQKYNILSINLSLAINNRRGMYDCSKPHFHTNDDAVDEIAAWVNWLEKKGSKRITMLGHSRGAAQIALYAAEQAHPLIHKVVLMAPATKDNGARNYLERYGQDLEPQLVKARSLIEKGKANTLLPNSNVMFCRDTNVSAKTLVSYYGEELRLDTPFLIAKIRKPILVIVAGDDEVVVGLEKKLAHLQQDQWMKMSIIDDSDHLFRDLNMDDAVENIVDFLRQKFTLLEK